MRHLILAALYAVAATAIAVPAQAGPLNCWYEPEYGPDIDIDSDGVVDPHSGPIIGFKAHCEGVESEEVEP